MTRSESWLRAGTVAAAIALVALISFVPPGTSDLWLDAALGRIIWHSGEIPHTLLFPFTEASQFPFSAHEWLSSAALYAFFRLVGQDHLVFVKGLLGLVLFGLCWRLAYRLSANLFAAVFVALAAMTAVNFRFYLRPELFGLFLFVIVLSLLAEFRAGGRWRYLLACIPAALAWANSHGSFPLALVLAGCFAAGAAAEGLRAPPGGRLRASWLGARPYLLCAGLMACAMLLNPYGANLFRVVWHLDHANFLRQYVYEWGAALHGPFAGSRGYWAFLGLLALSAAVLSFGWRSVPFAGALLLLVFGCLALNTQRHIVFFALASIYPLSAAMRGIAPRLFAPSPVRAAGLALIVACVGLATRYGNLYGGYPYYVPPHNFSLLLVEYLDRPAVKGNVLNSYELGSELIYRYYPRLRPAIDSRADAYGRKYFLELLHLNRDEHALKAFIARYHVDYILLLQRDFNLGIRQMPDLRNDGWHIVFVDGKVVLLGRAA
ncbi:MAG: hypothetical protein ACREUK_07370 [Burkholderiales bacterium]